MSPLYVSGHDPDVLNWLAAGMAEQQILDDYPELESEDFRAVYEFAAKLGRLVAL